MAGAAPGLLACGRPRGPAHRPCHVELPICQRCTVALVRAATPPALGRGGGSSSSRGPARLRQKTPVPGGPGPAIDVPNTTER